MIFRYFCDLDNIGQDHDVQHSHWMASVKLYRSCTWAFFLSALTVLHILNIIWFSGILWPWKYRSRSRCTTFAMTPFDGNYLTFYLMSMVILALSLTICEIFAKIIKCQKFWPEKWRSRRRRTPFDWKCSYFI